MRSASSQPVWTTKFSCKSEKIVELWRWVLQESDARFNTSLYISPHNIGKAKLRQKEHKHMAEEGVMPVSAYLRKKATQNRHKIAVLTRVEGR